MNKRDTMKLVQKYESIWYNPDESHLVRTYSVSNNCMPRDFEPIYVMNKIMRLIVRNITSEKNREYKYYKSRDGFGTLDVRYILKTHDCEDPDHGNIKVSVYSFRFETLEINRMVVMFIFTKSGTAIMTTYVEKFDEQNQPTDYQFTKDDPEYWMQEIRDSINTFAYTMGYRFDKMITYKEKPRRKKKTKTTEAQSE